MEGKFIGEHGDGPYVVEQARGCLPNVETAQIYETLRPVMQTHVRAVYLYIVAVKAVLESGGRLGIKRLYTIVGSMTGQSMEAARRCMRYAKDNLSYEVCNDCLFDGALSEKAFKYMTVGELVAYVTEKTLAAALRCGHAAARTDDSAA